MSIDLSTGCNHPSGMHIFNAHGDCQWCKHSRDEIELKKLRELAKGVINFPYRIEVMNRYTEQWAPVGMALTMTIAQEFVGVLNSNAMQMARVIGPTQENE